MVELGRPRSFDKKQALHAAMDVFWSMGFENASMTVLSKAMKLNPPSIYAAFGSKKDLFLKVVDYYAQTEGPTIWGNIENAPSAQTAIENMLKATAVAYTQTNPQRGCLVILAAPQSTGPHPEICSILKSRRMEAVTLLVDRLERGQKEGDVSQNADCQALARYYVTVQQGMSIQARDGASREALLDIANFAMAGWAPLMITRPPA